MKQGFTLVELLVTMAIFAVLGTIIVAIFANSLRGNNKSQVLSAIKQNGQAALDYMNQTIRTADHLICPVGVTSADTLVVVKSGVYTRFRIAQPNNNSVPTACSSNGCIVMDNPAKQLTQGVQFETDTEFINAVCAVSDPLPRSGGNGVFNILTDTNAQSGVGLQSGDFTVSKPAGYSSMVTVNFVLKPGAGAPQAVAGAVDPVSFRTAIEVRND